MASAPKSGAPARRPLWHALVPVMAALVPAAALLTARPLRAQAPSDLFLAPLSGAGTALRVGAPRRLTDRDGYDNQPAFAPDGRAILYTSIDSAGQADIFRYDIAAAHSTPLIRTAPESEYSAAVTPDGRRITVVRVEADSTQRLWSFDRTGGDARVALPEPRPVGYYAWADDTTLALYVLGDPATLRVASVRGGAARTVVRGIGRSIQKIPGRYAVSFVRETSADSAFVAELDLATGRTRDLVAALPGGDFHAWTPDGTLLMASGSRLYAWRPGEAGWRPLADLQRDGVTGITRLAVSPDGRTLALVADHTPTPHKE